MAHSHAVMTLRDASLAWPVALLVALAPCARADDPQPGARAFLGATRELAAEIGKDDGPDIKDEAFVPHVLPVLAGSTVEFPNEDDFYHNVFSVVAGDRFDLGRYAHGKSASQTLTKPGAVIVRCEIHSNMKAFILVLSNPFFAVPDPEGRLDIGNVPAGSY